MTATVLLLNKSGHVEIVTSVGKHCQMLSSFFILEIVASVVNIVNASKFLKIVLLAKIANLELENSEW